MDALRETIFARGAKMDGFIFAPSSHLRIFIFAVASWGANRAAKSAPTPRKNPPANRAHLNYGSKS
jgi:hypothetical protein